jgi:hypothetical protein
MSDATVRPGGSAHPTRQQLDDLEALMQRMLALPVNQVDDEPASDVSNDPGSIAAEASPPVQPPASEVRNDPVSEPESSWQPATAPATPQPATETVVLMVKTPAILGRVGHRWPRWFAPAVWPVVWINRTFDHWTTFLGRPGRWFRSRQGRALLGALGLLFMVVAVAWTILSLVGWTW